jgi:hypothetical protein
MNREGEPFQCPVTLGLVSSTQTEHRGADYCLSVSPSTEWAPIRHGKKYFLKKRFAARGETRREIAMF